MLNYALQTFFICFFSARYNFTSGKCTQIMPGWRLYAMFVESHLTPNFLWGIILCRIRGHFCTIALFAIIKPTRNHLLSVSVRYCLWTVGTACLEQRRRVARLGACKSRRMRDVHIHVLVHVLAPGPWLLCCCDNCIPRLFFCVHEFVSLCPSSDHLFAIHGIDEGRKALLQCDMCGYRTKVRNLFTVFVATR